MPRFLKLTLHFNAEHLKPSAKAEARAVNNPKYLLPFSDKKQKV